MDEQNTPSAEPGAWSLPPMRYPNAYTWLVFTSALDVVLTLLVIYVWEGHEVNPVAAAVIAYMGFFWAIVFKFATIVLVILLCEWIGRMRDRSGFKLAWAAVMISGVVVSYTFVLLFRAGPILPPPETVIGTLPNQ